MFVLGRECLLMIALLLVPSNTEECTAPTPQMDFTLHQRRFVSVRHVIANFNAGAELFTPAKTPKNTVAYFKIKVTGVWYFAERHTPQTVPTSTNVCQDLFVRYDEPFITLKSFALDGLEVEIIAEEPWKWKVAGREHATWVVYLSPDDGVLVVASCVGSSDYHSYIMLSRRLPLTQLEREDAYYVIRAAGVRTSKEFNWWNSTADCTQD